MADANTNILRIGDYVTFKNLKFNSLLCAEGILLEDITVDERVKVLDDCLFCIHLQRQYSAARELEDFLKIKKDEDDANTAKYFNALKRGSDNETRLNDSYMKKKMGQIVLFGDIVQLYHVKSGKYLTVTNDLLAKDERENIRVHLCSNGSSLSWLQLLPRYKIDREGDRILSRSEVYLRCSERSNEYIHRADRDPLPGNSREVNCSLEPTSWRLNIFRSSTDSLDKHLILASQLVYISDPETRCNLTIALPAVEDLDGDLEDGDKEGEGEDEGSQGGADGGGSRSLVEEDDAMGMTLPSAMSAAGAEKEDSLIEGDVEFFHDYGDLILQPFSDHISSDCYWFVEAQSLLYGGPIKLKTDRVRFKHMNTGLYLKCSHVEKTDPETGNMEEEIVFTTTTKSHLPGTLFSVEEVNATSKLLSNSKALQIGHNGSWIERGDVLDDGDYIVKGTKEKTIALSLILNRFSSGGAALEAEDAGSVAAGGAAVAETEGSSGGDASAAAVGDALMSKEPMDVYVGLAARGYLRKYYNMTQIPRSDHIDTIWPAANRADLEFFRMVVQKVVFFSQGFPISAEDVQLGIDKADAVLRRNRQNLLRKQNTLEVVLRMINRLIPISDKLDQIKNSTGKKKKVVSEQEQSMLSMGRLVLGWCFNLLYYSILDNQENQMYVADFMPVLLAHLSSQPRAGKCVTEMLSKNLELQETKIGTREIQIFVDKLRSSKMNAMYLQLLQACCSCEGNGVDGNQCKVANMLFSNTNDIIINLHADYTHTIPVTWDQPSLYVSLTPIPGSPIRGDTLIGKGLPQLSLAWTTNSIDFSPLGLFGKLSVNVEELFSTKFITDAANPDGPAKKTKNKKKSTQDQKDAVANYFVAEMFLGAEMCMDRNYVAMHKLDDLFSYEVLVSIIKLDVSTNLKSAAVRLLMCLHVDRDPQATSKIPLLTRTWTDIEKNTEPQLPYVDAGRRYMFGLIQQMVSEHIRGMSGARWDELSRHMLKMLRTMVEFNFYGTNDRMNDVIGPLVAALDRRQVGAADAKALQRAVQDERLRGADSAPDLNDISKEPNEESYNQEDDLLEKADDDMRGQKSSAWSITDMCSSVLNIFTMGKAARVSGEDDSSGTAVEGYQSPIRYSKAPIYELETMVEAVDILAFAQHVIEDRNVSLLLRYFYRWHNGEEKREPDEFFEELVNESRQLTLDIADFDNVMIDVLMFMHTPLMQSTLEVLMAHHSMRRTLLDNANSVQLLASHGRERQYRIVDQMLQQLEQNAETHELWGELETEADNAVNKQTQDILSELTDICRIRRKVLEFDEDYEADREIQDLYRNLGCFDICMKVLGLLDSVEEDEDGELDEVAQNTRHLCLMCNTLLFWFLLGNEKNQAQGYKQINTFLDTLDDEINSHLLISAIFKNNEALMRMVPHSHLQELVDKIVKNGKSHHYLSLFAAISHVGEKNIVENQFEIVKKLTGPGRLQKVAWAFVPVDHPEYAEKRELMQPFLGREEDLSLDDLPPQLAYHLMFLDVLSGCTVGRMNITTVEAKVQSVYAYTDILQSVMDSSTITIVKTKLLKFFYNSIIEVELKIPGLEQAPAVWQLLDSFRETLLDAKSIIQNAETLGWDSKNVSRQKIEHILVSIMVIGGFFQHYYRASAFQSEDRAVSNPDHSASVKALASASAASGPPATATKKQVSLSHVNELILFFFDRIKQVHDLRTEVLSLEMRTMIYETLNTLNVSTSGDTTIATRIKPVHDGGWTDSSKKPDDGELELTVDPEQALIASYKEFLGLLSNDSAIQYKADNENVAFISILERLPFIADQVESDVRYETLIRKLVSHIRENITYINNNSQKRLDARVTKTSTWIIRAFRTMIENRMGMSIYERDDEGGQEQDEAAAPVVNALNSCGATALCLELIADGIDEGLQLECIKLGVGLLFKEGGALEVQGIMNNHLSKTQSDLFFKQVRLTLQKLQAWHTWNEVVILEDDEEPKHPDEILIVRMLQLMCEGHYLPNQDIMREQPNNAVSYNLLDDYVNYLNCLSRIPCRTSTTAGIRLSATILEVIQGPCEGNQAHFALNTELIETLNRLNRAKVVNDCAEDEEVEMKKTSIDIFQGLLEGQGEKSPVYERVLSVIHLDIIQMMSKGDILERAGDNKDHEKSSESEDPDLAEEVEILKTECIVLLQMLCNFKPSLYDELGISRNIEDIVGSGTAMIEVIWRGDIHRRFFHVPSICSFLAKSSKDNLVENVDRSNSENKLIDFLNRSHEMYREVKHQQLLTEWNVSAIFSRSSQDRVTWGTFALAFATNMLLMIFYSAGTIEGGPEDARVPNEAFVVIRTLNLIQCISSAFVIVLFLVVRAPVRYQQLEEAGHNQFECILHTATDPMTLYYIWYFAMAALGQFVSYDFLPFLLLDVIVKNSTTRDVLNAVIYPRNQIAMGGVVTLFVVQIYAFLLFSYFRDDIYERNHFCDTLYGCYKVALGYGLRMGGGVGDVFNPTVGERWPLDVSFFFIVNVGMLNLVAGVIITTFGQLREDKARRTADTELLCFICGIHKQTFDRASDEPDGFKTHIKVDHNMWNYLYFIFMLWEQDKDDDDGLEQYVRRAIDANEIIWFPLNKAIRLDQAASVEESLLHELKKSIVNSEGNVAGKLDKFQTDINIVLEQLNQTLKSDHVVDRVDSSFKIAALPPSRSTKIGGLRGTTIVGLESASEIASRAEELAGHTARTWAAVKVLGLELLDICNLELSPSESYDRIVCQVTADNNLPTQNPRQIFCSEITNGTMTFTLNNKFPLLSDVDMDDERNCTIKLLKETTNPANLIEIISIRIPVLDLLLADGLLFESFFRLPGKEVNSVLRLIPSVLPDSI